MRQVKVRRFGVVSPSDAKVDLKDSLTPAFLFLVFIHLKFVPFVDDLDSSCQSNIAESYVS